MYGTHDFVLAISLQAGGVLVRSAMSPASNTPSMVIGTVKLLTVIP